MTRALIRLSISVACFASLAVGQHEHKAAPSATTRSVAGRANVPVKDIERENLLIGKLWFAPNTGVVSPKTGTLTSARQLPVLFCILRKYYSQIGWEVHNCCTVFPRYA